MILYGEIPDVVGKYKGKNLLVCGSARCLWDDLTKINPKDFDVMAINYVGLFLREKIIHWFSGYPEVLGPLRRLREVDGRGGKAPRIKTHSRFYYPGVDYVWKAEKYGFGTSSLDACSIGLLMGYDKILIAGSPLDNTNSFYESPGEAEGIARIGDIPSYVEAWQWWNEKYFKGRVRSLSGKTKEICGGWFDEDQDNQFAVCESTDSENDQQTEGNTEDPENITASHDKDDYAKAFQTHPDRRYFQERHEKGQREIAYG
jgi:hypothetical protein